MYIVINKRLKYILVKFVDFHI